jgi:hypothetical protein
MCTALTYCKKKKRGKSTLFLITTLLKERKPITFSIERGSRKLRI